MSDKQRGDNYGQYRAAATSATLSCLLPNTRLADHSQSGNLSQVGHGQSANPHTTLHGVQKHDSSTHSVPQKGQSSVPRHSNLQSELEMVFQKRLKQPKKKFQKETPNSSSTEVSKSPPQQVDNAKPDSRTVSTSIQSSSQLQPQKHSHFSISSPTPPPRSSSLQKAQDEPTTNGQVQNVGISGYRKVIPRGIRTPRSFNQEFSDFTDSEDCRTPDVSVFNMSEGYRTPLESEDEADTASKHSYAASSTRFPFKSEIVKHFEKPVPVFLKCQTWCNQIPNTEPRQQVSDTNLNKELQNIESFESAMLDWFQTLNKANDDDDLRSETSVSSMGSCKSEYRLRSLINSRFQNSEQIENVLTDLLAISDQYAQVTDTGSVVSESQKQEKHESFPERQEKHESFQTLNLEKKYVPRRGRATVIRRSSASGDISGSESESEHPRKRGSYKTVLSELQSVLRQRQMIPEPPESEESGLGSSEYSNPPTSPLSPTSAPPTMPKPQFPKVHEPRVARTAQVTRKPLVNAGDFKLLLGQLSTAWSKRLKRIRKAQMVSQRGMQSSLYANFQGFRIPEVLLDEKSTKYANFEGKLEPTEVLNPNPEPTSNSYNPSCESAPKTDTLSKPMFCRSRGQGNELQVLPSEISKKERVYKSQSTETQSVPSTEITGRELLEFMQQPGLKKTGFKMNKYIKNVASGGVLPEITEEGHIPSPSHRKLVAVLNKDAEFVPTSVHGETKMPTHQSIPGQILSPTSGPMKSLPQTSQVSSPSSTQFTNIRSPSPSYMQSPSPTQIRSPPPPQVKSPVSDPPQRANVHSSSSFQVSHMRSPPPPPPPQRNSPALPAQLSSQPPQVWSPSSIPSAQVWCPPSHARSPSPAQVKSPLPFQQTMVRSPPPQVRSPPPLSRSQVRSPPTPPRPHVGSPSPPPRSLVGSPHLHAQVSSPPPPPRMQTKSPPPPPYPPPPPPLHVRSPPLIPPPPPPPPPPRSPQVSSPITLSETLGNNAIISSTDVQIKAPVPMSPPHSQQGPAFTAPPNKSKYTSDLAKKIDKIKGENIRASPDPAIRKTLMAGVTDLSEQLTSTITKVVKKTEERPVSKTMSSPSILSSENIALTSQILPQSEPVKSYRLMSGSISPTITNAITCPEIENDKKVILERLNKIGERNVIVKEELPELPMDIVKASAIKIKPLLTENLNKLVHNVKEGSKERSPLVDERQESEVILDFAVTKEPPAGEDKVELSGDVKIPLEPSKPEILETSVLSEKSSVSQNKVDVDVRDFETAEVETNTPCTDVEAEVTYDISLENTDVYKNDQPPAGENKSENHFASTELDSVMETVLLNLKSIDSLLPEEAKTDKSLVSSEQNKGSQETDICSFVSPVSFPDNTAIFEVYDNVDLSVSVSANEEDFREVCEVTMQENESVEKRSVQEIEACIVVSPVFSAEGTTSHEEHKDVTTPVLVNDKEEDSTKLYEAPVGENESYDGEDISFSVVLEDSFDTEIITPTEELENLWVNPSPMPNESLPDKSTADEFTIPTERDITDFDIQPDRVEACEPETESISSKSLECLPVKPLIVEDPTLVAVTEIETFKPEVISDWMTVPDVSSEPLPSSPEDVSTVVLQEAEAPPVKVVSDYAVTPETLTESITVPGSATESTELAPFISVISLIEPEMPVFETPPEVFDIPVQNLVSTEVNAGAFAEILEQKAILYAPSEKEDNNLTEEQEISFDQLKHTIKEEMLKSEDISKVLVLESMKSSGPNGSPDDCEYEDAICYSSDDSLTFEDTLTSPVLPRRVYKEVVRAEIGSRVETLQSWAKPEPLKSWPNQENLQLCTEEEATDLAEDLNPEEFHEAEDGISNKDEVPFNSDQQQLVYTLPTIYEATEESLEEERRILREIDHVDQLIGECVETLEMSPVELAQVQEQDPILRGTELPDFISEMKFERDVRIGSVLCGLANLKNGPVLPAGTDDSATLFGELKRSQGLTALDQICADQSSESPVQDGSPEEKASDHIGPEISSDEEIFHSIPYNVDTEKFEEEILPAMSRKVIFDKMGVGKVLEEKLEETEDEISPPQTRSEKTSEDEEDSVKNWMVEAGKTELQLPSVMPTQQSLADKFENLIEYLESDAAKELQEFERIESACERLSKEHRKDSVVSDVSLGNLEKSDDFEMLIKSLDSELEDDGTQNVLTNPKEDLVPGVVLAPINEDCQKMDICDSDDHVNHPKDFGTLSSKEDFFDAYSEAEYSEYMLCRDPEDSGYVDAVPIGDTTDDDFKKLMMLKRSKIQAMTQSASPQADEEVNEDAQSCTDSDYLNYMRDREMETYELMTSEVPVMSCKATDVQNPALSINEKAVSPSEFVITSLESEEQEHGTISEDISLMPASSIETNEMPVVVSDEIEEEYFTIRGAEHTVEKAFEYLLSSKTALLKDNETSPESNTFSSAEHSGSTSVKEFVALQTGDSLECEAIKLSNKDNVLEGDNISITETQSKNEVSNTNAQEAIMSSCTSVTENTIPDGIYETKIVDTVKSIEVPLSSSLISRKAEPKTDSSVSSNLQTEFDGKALATTCKTTTKVRSSSSSSSSSSSTEHNVSYEHPLVPPESLSLSEDSKDTAANKKKRKKKKKKGKGKEEPVTPSNDIKELLLNSEKSCSDQRGHNIEMDTESNIAIKKSNEEAIVEIQDDVKCSILDSGRIDPSEELQIKDQPLESPVPSLPAFVPAMSYEETASNLLTSDSSMAINEDFIVKAAVPSDFTLEETEPSSEPSKIPSDFVSSEIIVKSEKQNIVAGEFLEVSLSVNPALESLEPTEVQATDSADSKVLSSSAVSSDQLESTSECFTETNSSKQPLEAVMISENATEITSDALPKKSAPLAPHLKSEPTLSTISHPSKHPAPIAPHLDSYKELASVTSLKQPAPVAPPPSSSLPKQPAPVAPPPSSSSPKQPSPVAPPPSSSSPKQPAPIAPSPSSSPKQPAPVAPSHYSSSPPKQPAPIAPSPSPSPKQPAPVAPSSSSKQQTPIAPSLSSSPKQPAPVAPPSPSSSSKQQAPIAPSSLSSSLQSSAMNTSQAETTTSSSVSLESNRDVTSIALASKVPVKIKSGTELSESYQRKAAFLASVPQPVEGSFLHRGSSSSSLSELKFVQPPPLPRSLRDQEPPQPPAREHSMDNIPSDSLKSESTNGAPLCAPEDTKIINPSLEHSKTAHSNGLDESSTLAKSSQSQSLIRTNSPAKRFRDLKHFSRISNMTYNEVIEMEEEEDRRRYDFGTSRRLREMRYFGRMCRVDSEESMMSKKSVSSDSGILAGYHDLKHSRGMTTSSTSLQAPGASAVGGHRPKGMSDSAVSIDNPKEFEPIMSYVTYSQSENASPAEIQRYSSSVSGRANTLQPSDRHRQDVSAYGRIQKGHDITRSTHSLDYHAGHSRFVHPGVGLGDQDVASQGFQDSGLCASNFSVSGQDSDDSRSMVSSVSFIRPVENIVMDDDSESIYEDVAMYPSSETLSMRSDAGSVKSLSKLKKFGSKLKKFSKFKIKKFWK